MKPDDNLPVCMSKAKFQTKPIADCHCLTTFRWRHEFGWIFNLKLNVLCQVKSIWMSKIHQHHSSLNQKGYFVKCSVEFVDQRNHLLIVNVFVCSWLTNGDIRMNPIFQGFCLKQVKVQETFFYLLSCLHGGVTLSFSIFISILPLW